MKTTLLVLLLLLVDFAHAARQTETVYSLNELVALHHLPQSAQLYEVRSVDGELFHVRFSSSLIKELNKESAQTAERLMKALIRNDASKSKVKALFDIGPNIVEVKAKMHGHKRIIGCLEGRYLELRRLMEIKDTRDAYFRRIPANFCY